jgi:hypothetical protein
VALRVLAGPRPGKPTNTTSVADRGAPLDLRNLMLRPFAGSCNAHTMDDLERQLSTRRLSIMVCVGDLTLKGAQHDIATDWRGAYKKRLF